MHIICQQSSRPIVEGTGFAILAVDDHLPAEEPVTAVLRVSLSFRVWGLGFRVFCGRFSPTT